MQILAQSSIITILPRYPANVYVCETGCRKSYWPCSISSWAPRPRTPSNAELKVGQ
jgi:hypothetical protein